MLPYLVQGVAGNQLLPCLTVLKYESTVSHVIIPDNNSYSQFKMSFDSDDDFLPTEAPTIRQQPKQAKKREKKGLTFSQTDTAESKTQFMACLDFNPYLPVSSGRAARGKRPSCRLWRSWRWMRRTK